MVTGLDRDRTLRNSQTAVSGRERTDLSWMLLAIALGILGLSGLSSRVTARSPSGRFVAMLNPEVYVVHLAHPLVLLMIREAVDG